ncbi:transporter substrate-binding domain-containing protein [Salidesulfovibrio brasiliensis]|uniref:transporter substrate-binding domain-containing protein n=1 Tax=Salidesulfovibrio brasiliensis TaxID=221711 RepID=UPI0006D03A86|nr:transporter substrate-binding domain-containing protein [Salidesulfovibrio brasiliensis]
MSRIIAVAALFILLTTAFAAAEPLRVATEGAYPPFNYIDENGEPAGFDVEMAKAICTALSRKCEIVVVPWNDIITRLVKGDYDMVVASMAKTPERDKLIDFTDHYYRSRSNFVGEAGRFPQATPEVLTGRTIAAQKGTVQENYLYEHYGTSNIRSAGTTKEAFDLLVAGEVDAVLSDSLTIYEFLQTPRGRTFDFIGSALPASDVSSFSHIAVAEGNDELCKQINHALKRLRAEGTYDRINKKYFPFSIY